MVWDNIKSYLSDDFSNGSSNFKGFVYIGVFSNRKMVGAFSVRGVNGICCEVHGGVIKEFWGYGCEICKTAIDFFFSNSIYLKMIAIVPVYNRAMIRCLLKNSFEIEGRLKKSFLKRYVLFDQIVLGRGKRG